MNNFTKGELKILLNCIFCTISEYNDDEEKSLELLAHKLAIIIDNYCEHEWINGTYCEKCNRTPTER